MQASRENPRRASPGVFIWITAVSQTADCLIPVQSQSACSRPSALNTPSVSRVCISLPTSMIGTFLPSASQWLAIAMTPAR